MKISQVVDTKVDQNEIESKYVWYYKTAKALNQVNLSTLHIDSSWASQNDCFMIPCLILPNNQIYGLGINVRSNLQSKFIIDENSNIKRIESPEKTNKCMIALSASCYYEGSIFTFKNNFGSGIDSPKNLAKRYLFSDNKWIMLCSLPFKSPISCIGFNQKILIVADFPENNGVWIYDIALDSYSRKIPANDIWIDSKAMIKSEGKVYLLSSRQIYATEDPLSEWTIVSVMKDCLSDDFTLKALYKGSIYYVRKTFLYNFNLKTVKSNSIKNLMNICVYKKNYKTYNA